MGKHYNAADDARILADIAAGVSRQAIAKSLGRTCKAISIHIKKLRAAGHQIAQIPCGRKHFEWTPALDAALVSAAAAGKTRKEIAMSMGLCVSALSVRVKYLRSLGHAVSFPKGPRKSRPSIPHQREPRRVKSERSCLGCSKPFKSDGPHNRLCPNCKEAARHASPYAP